MTTTRAALLYAGSTILLTAACLTVAPSHAHVDLPLHHVKYTLTAKNPIYAQIFSPDQEPDIFAYWSDIPYQYMPNVEADLGPNHPAWTYELDLHKPEEWARVVANTWPEPGTTNLHC